MNVMKETPPPLNLDGEGLKDLLAVVSAAVASFVDGIENAPALYDPLSPEDETLLRAAPKNGPGNASALVERCIAAARVGLEVTGPRNFAYIPSGGLPEAAAGELLALVLNRYVTLRQYGAGLAAIEDGVLRWMTALFGLPESSGGLLTTGGSQAMLAMMVAARERVRSAGGSLDDARLYVSDQAHHCIAKAAHIAGLPAVAVRTVPTRDGGMLDAEMVEAAIREDRAAGLTPFLLVATAGTTNLGRIDPLAALSDVARAHDLWFHVDACYGGFFILTERGRARLAGIERADSITLDPHKSLFLPFGTGALLVRDPRRLAAAHKSGKQADYLGDISATDEPEYADLGSELTREARGVRLWLPLHLHGLDAFRDALDEKLDLANRLYEALGTIPELEMLAPPDLTIVTARMPDDVRTRAVIDRVNASGEA
jgi:aromatic-L-amino-acid decarboxylase